MKNCLTKRFIVLFIFAACQVCIFTNLNAQASNEPPFIIGDALPDAPELSARGTYKVGVQTLEWVNKGQINILKSKKGVDTIYDRPLKVEVWYPSIIPEGVKELISYDEVLGTFNDPKRPLKPFTFMGRALRNATPQYSEGAFPLVIVSHGYVGSRYLLPYYWHPLSLRGNF